MVAIAAWVIPVLPVRVVDAEADAFTPAGLGEFLNDIAFEEGPIDYIGRARASRDKENEVEPEATGGCVYPLLTIGRSKA